MRFLYLARHGEATPDETGLTDTGRRQAELLGERLRDLPIQVIHHGPLPRAAQTASIVSAHLPGVPVHVSEAAGDYVPWFPGPDAFPGEDREIGPALAREAEATFTGVTDEPRTELVITHGFLIAWLVRAALEAPEARWIGLNSGNTGLTCIRYSRDRPPAPLFFNDMGHLPPELRWTGFPPALRPSGTD
uniref:histidine phosphatase family protein n=1 Tax=Herbidospora sakaeratensis TaxID=564415 RepID=UPI0007864C36|nr:histidine phosphatase family protein [Herbidospora sakaeratensis]